MPILFANDATSSLQSGITTSATQIAISSADAGLFPAPTGGDYFMATVVDQSGNMEIMKCTARAGAVLTVTRAQEGTTAVAFAAGAVVDLRITKGTMETLAQIGHAHSINDITGLPAALDGKAAVISPALSGTPTAPTAALGTNTTQIATMAAVREAIVAITGGAPAALDAFNEFAAALGNDPNFAGTMTTALASKLNASAYTAADVLSKLLTVDGSGSGLDADKVRNTTPGAFGLALLAIADATSGRTALGLGNVENTSDINKPISTAVQAALDGKIPSSDKGVASGVATLDGSGKVPSSQLPTSGSYKGTWNAAANSPALTSGSGANGDYYKISVAGSTTIDGVSSWTVGDEIRFGSGVWQKIPNYQSVSSVAGKTGTVTLAKGDIGLPDVDNTSDLAKPISSATQAALDGKSASGHSHGWTEITGKPSAFTPATHSHTTSEVTGLDAYLAAKADSSHVGSGGAAHAAATTGTAGFMSATDKAKLDGVQAGATTNATDAALRDRSTHTGVQTISTVTGLQAALDGKQSTIGFTPENSAAKGAANGYAPLDATSKIPTAYLPAYVDDVIDAVNFAALPASGETGKIYTTLDNGKIYRWSGSVYVEISGSPGSTDAVTEGATNKYYTDARAQAALAAALAGKSDIAAGIPTGGATGQVLSKSSAADYAATWRGLTAGDIASGTIADARLPPRLTNGDVIYYSVADVPNREGSFFIWSGATDTPMSLLGSPGLWHTGSLVPNGLFGDKAPGFGSVMRLVPWLPTSTPRIFERVYGYDGWGAWHEVSLPALDARFLLAGNIVGEANLPLRMRYIADRTLTDWNNAVQNGWYASLGGANAPVPGAYAMGYVSEFGDNGWTTQKVWLFTDVSPENGHTWKRYRKNGVWGSWFRTYENGPELDARYLACANVRHFGAVGNDNTDDTAAFLAAIATGKDVFIPRSRYRVTGILQPVRRGQRFIGEGRTESVITVDAGTFNMSAAAIFKDTGEPGCQIIDIGFHCHQPDTNVRANLYQYPTVLLLQNCPRHRVIRVRVTGGMTGVDIRGNSGGILHDDVETTAFEYDYRIDGALDTTRLYSIHTWVFNTTAAQREILADANCVGLDLGRIDGIKIIAPLIFRRRKGVLARIGSTEFGGAGNQYPAFGSIIGAGFDDRSGIHIERGNVNFLGGYSSLGALAMTALVLRGGQTSFSGFHWWLTPGYDGQPLFDVANVNDLEGCILSVANNQFSSVNADGVAVKLANIHNDGTGPTKFTFVGNSIDLPSIARGGVPLISISGANQRWMINSNHLTDAAGGAASTFISATGSGHYGSAASNLAPNWVNDTTGLTSSTIV